MSTPTLKPPFDTDPFVLSINHDDIYGRCLPILFRETARRFLEQDVADLAGANEDALNPYQIAARLRYSHLDDCMDYDIHGGPEQGMMLRWFGSRYPNWGDDVEAEVIGLLLMAEFIENPPAIPFKDYRRPFIEMINQASLDEVKWLLTESSRSYPKDIRARALERLIEAAEDRVAELAAGESL